MFYQLIEYTLMDLLMFLLGYHSYDGPSMFTLSIGQVFNVYPLIQPAIKTYILFIFISTIEI